MFYELETAVRVIFIGPEIRWLTFKKERKLKNLNNIIRNIFHS